MSAIDDYARQVAAAATRSGHTVAIAESLTCGRLVAALGAAPGSSAWLHGAVVAYSTAVKQRVLGMPDAPAVSEVAASAMAGGVRELLDTDIAVSVTGVGGPDSQDGEPAGSVWLAVDSARGIRARHELFHGTPEQVVQQTIEAALCMILDALQEPSENRCGA
ncbi:CinA family protein [Nocardia niigatensis]|uniref:CinA family protein n=1 Tax=Nocardia niigatensis TaxID=209249 RepID=UPI0002E5BB6E|nr:CinA family protein [Nocardia niigatensis]